MAKLHNLVAGRECGECTACCTYLTIDTEELQKSPGVTCKHCIVSKGCAIYHHRPKVCTNFYCGWRELPNLDDAWRPDRSGVLIRFKTDEAGNLEMQFQLIGALDAAEQRPFVVYVSTMVMNNVRTFVLVPGKPGETSGKAYLNDILSGPIARQDYPETVRLLKMAVQAAARHQKETVVFTHKKPEAAG